MASAVNFLLTARAMPRDKARCICCGQSRALCGSRPTTLFADTQIPSSISIPLALERPMWWPSEPRTVLSFFLARRSCTTLQIAIFVHLCRCGIGWSCFSTAATTWSCLSSCLVKPVSSRRACGWCRCCVVRPAVRSDAPLYTAY